MSAVPPGKNTEHPESVGRYRIIRRLGEGGMGSVFLALDTILHREVALKLPLTGTENDPEVRERFLREARSAATLDHPYICRVHDADFVDGRLYMAMAYIEGKSLAELVRAEGIPPRQVVALVGKLAIAMNEAHLKGVVHRDLKPRNVMIRTVGSKKEPVIVDFGIARLETVEDMRMTKTGEIMGTPAYMAPEQLRGKPDEIGPPCDIYALGVILYELLTGQLPFSGNYPVMVAQILMQPALPPSTHRQGLDPVLDAICLKAMAKKGSDRYASMMELATALTEYLRAAPSVSLSNRSVSPISRPIEGDSIATGADTLVSQMLGRSAEREKRLGLGSVLDSPPAAISTDPVRVPTSGSSSLDSAAPASGRRGPLWWGLAASSLLGVMLIAWLLSGVFEVKAPEGTIVQENRLIVDRPGNKDGDEKDESKSLSEKKGDGQSAPVGLAPIIASPENQKSVSLFNGKDVKSAAGTWTQHNEATGLVIKLFLYEDHTFKPSHIPNLTGSWSQSGLNVTLVLVDTYAPGGKWITVVTLAPDGQSWTGTLKTNETKVSATRDQEVRADVALRSAEGIWTQHNLSNNKTIQYILIKTGDAHTFKQSNNTVPTGTWSQNGSNVTLRMLDSAAPGGEWVNEWTLDPDGKTYSGVNTKTGQKLSGTRN